MTLTSSISDESLIHSPNPVATPQSAPPDNIQAARGMGSS